MPLYTFLMEFKGGTYCSQVRARSERQAINKWAEEIDPREIRGLGARGKMNLIAEVKSESFVSLNDRTNVWCLTPHINGQLIFVNLVKTADK